MRCHGSSPNILLNSRSFKDRKSWGVSHYFLSFKDVFCKLFIIIAMSTFSYSNLNYILRSNSSLSLLLLEWVLVVTQDKGSLGIKNDSQVLITSRVWARIMTYVSYKIIFYFTMFHLPMVLCNLCIGYCNMTNENWLWQSSTILLLHTPKWTRKRLGQTTYCTEDKSVNKFNFHYIQGYTRLLFATPWYGTIY